MTGDGSEHDGSTNEPGEIVEHALSDITAADDAEGVATAATRAFERLLDTDVECFLHGDDGELIAAASNGEPTADAIELDGAPTGGELAWPADPLRVPVADAGWLVCRADTDERGPSWAVRSIARVAVDAASQRVRQQERERRIEELETETEQLSNFATIVAHDLRNPLAIAQGHLELARDLHEEEHYERIAEAHDRIQRIIDHTLTMAQQDGESATSERVETGAVAHDAWDTVETGAATLTVTDSVRLVADRDRLQQLFENLFRNAVEHGLPETQVECNGGNDPAAGAALAVEVGTLGDDEGFFVEDTGPGIPENERSAVFERGYSDDGGTGLGLSIIEEIVTEHDWSVAVADGRAGGARFEIAIE